MPSNFHGADNTTYVNVLASPGNLKKGNAVPES